MPEVMGPLVLFFCFVLVFQSSNPTYNDVAVKWRYVPQHEQPETAAERIAHRAKWLSRGIGNRAARTNVRQLRLTSGNDDSVALTIA